jgi:hypothetical protein
VDVAEEKEKYHLQSPCPLHSGRNHELPGRHQPIGMATISLVKQETWKATYFIHDLVIVSGFSQIVILFVIILRIVDSERSTLHQSGCVDSL